MNKQKKREMLELANEVLNVFQAQKASMLNLIAQNARRDKQEIEYLKMIWEQSHQATDTVRKFFDNPILFEKIYHLTEEDFK